MTEIEVWDSVVKIGLGALISALASYITQYRNQRHELAKDIALHKRQMSASKKLLYVDFLTTSHVLVQRYRESQCRADGEDYFAYLRLYHELEIVAADPLRICAHKLLYAVNDLITFHKADRNADDRELFRAMRARVDEVIGEFQYVAKQDIDEPARVQ